MAFIGSQIPFVEKYKRQKKTEWLPVTIFEVPVQNTITIIEGKVFLLVGDDNRLIKANLAKKSSSIDKKNVGDLKTRIAGIGGGNAGKKSSFLF